MSARPQDDPRFCGRNRVSSGHGASNPETPGGPIELGFPQTGDSRQRPGKEEAEGPPGDSGGGENDDPNRQPRQGGLYLLVSQLPVRRSNAAPFSSPSPSHVASWLMSIHYRGARCACLPGPMQPARRSNRPLPDPHPESLRSQRSSDRRAPGSPPHDQPFFTTGPITKIEFPNGSLHPNVRPPHDSFIGGRLISTFRCHSR